MSRGSHPSDHAGTRLLDLGRSHGASRRDAPRPRRHRSSARRCPPGCRARGDQTHGSPRHRHIAEAGEPAEYERFLQTVGPLLERLDAPLVVAAGNHDDRRAMREILLSEAPSPDPLDLVHVIDDLRIVVVDSSVPGEGYGQLRPAQLEWLAAELRRPAARGTVLAMHHPPLPSSAPLAAAIELQNRDQLAEVLRGTDVRIVLAGHTHVVSAGAIAGVPVWTGGAIATTLDGLAPGFELRGVSTPSVSRVDLFGDHEVVVTSISVGARTMTNVSSSDMELQVAALRRRLPS